MNTSRLPTQPSSQSSKPGSSIDHARLARLEWLSSLPDNQDLDPKTISDVERWKHDARVEDIIRASQVDNAGLNGDIWKAAASGQMSSVWGCRPRQEQIVDILRSYETSYMIDRQRVSKSAHQQIATSLGVDHDLWSRYIDGKLTPGEIGTVAKEWPALGGDSFEEKIKSLPVWETAEGSHCGDREFRHDLSKASRLYREAAKSIALQTWLSNSQGQSTEISEFKLSPSEPSFSRDDNGWPLRERPDTPSFDPV